MNYIIRYKTKRGVIPQHIPLLKSFTDSLNSKRTKWTCTTHALNRIDTRFEKHTIINHIEHTKKRLEYIYEYCMKYSMIEKVCYAIPFNQNTLGSVCLKNRVLITAYIMESTNWLKSVYNSWGKILINH